MRVDKSIDMRKSIFQKGLIIMGLVASVGFLTSCGDDPVVDNDGDIVVDDDYYEFQDFSLDEHEIPAMISLPDETANIGASTKPEIVHIQSDIKWEVKVGPNFQLMIEDYADFTDLIEVKKKDYFENNSHLMLTIYRLFSLYENTQDLRFLNLLLKLIDWMPIYSISQKKELRIKALNIYEGINNSSN